MTLETLMTTFAQPVSMQVTQDQFNDLKPQLERLGYICVDLDDEIEKYLITNYSGKNTEFSTIWKKDKVKNFTRYFIDHYNPELFLAIAAMTTGDKFIMSEWYFAPNSGLLLQVKYDEQLAIVNYHNNLRKPTLQQLIEHFDKSEIMQPKVDRNLVIKCATPQEQELVKQWLIDKGEEISKDFTHSGAIKYPYFRLSINYINAWTNVSQAPPNKKIVTPQELGIIPAPIDEFKNGDVVDCLGYDGDINWEFGYTYIGKEPLTGKHITVSKYGTLNRFYKVRNPIKKVTMQQVADKFGYELGSFKIEG